ncbi:protein eiger-like isoform X27 [Ptychodera flava]|uniref:protein eiger-like isoform X27 n=1 Tax=Ptychodera flava TaxID=63121 RepID=UPI003969C906
MSTLPGLTSTKEREGAMNGLALKSQHWHDCCCESRQSPKSCTLQVVAALVIIFTLIFAFVAMFFIMRNEIATIRLELHELSTDFLDLRERCDTADLTERPRPFSVDRDTAFEQHAEREKNLDDEDLWEVKGYDQQSLNKVDGRQKRDDDADAVQSDAAPDNGRSTRRKNREERRRKDKKGKKCKQGCTGPPGEPAPKFLAAHFQGDSEAAVHTGPRNPRQYGEVTVGRGGEIHYWDYADWMKKPSYSWLQNKFVLDHQGNITIQDSGLYYIYSQITFLDANAFVGHSVHIGDYRFLRCKLFRDFKVPLIIQQYHTCHVSGIAQVESGQKVYVRLSHSELKVDIQSDSSYIGLYRLR